MIHVIDLRPVQHEHHAYLTPALAARARQFATEHDETVDPHLMAGDLLSRLWGRDPDLKVLLLATDEGQIVGHLIVTMQRGSKNVLFILQAKADGDVGDAMKRAAEQVEAWGRSQGATVAVGITSRNPDAWKRSYGYKLTRSVVTKDLMAAVNGG